MSKVKLDEEFLQWWAESMEKNGIDLDEKLLKISAHPPFTLPSKIYLYHVYSYNDYFEAMRRGDHWPLVAYHLAYRMCWRTVLENSADNDPERVVPPWKR